MHAGSFYLYGTVDAAVSPSINHPLLHHVSVPFFNGFPDYLSATRTRTDAGRNTDDCDSRASVDGESAPSLSSDPRVDVLPGEDGRSAG